MKKIRPAIFAVLLLALVLCFTACGRNKSGTSTSGAGQGNVTSGAASGTSAGTQTGGSTTGQSTETREGVIDGLVNDVEEGARDVGKGIEGMTGETTGRSETSAGETTGSGAAGTTGTR